MIRTNRKRNRNIEEESSEFMPLSKRINNLHINSLSGLRENVIESRMESMETDWESGNFMSSPSCSQNSSPRGSCGSSQSNFNNDYRPDLDATENPFIMKAISCSFPYTWNVCSGDWICIEYVCVAGFILPAKYFLDI